MTPAEALALVQRSDAWFQACVGSIGASRVHDIIAKGAGGAPSASRKNLLAQIVVETLTGKSASSGFKTAAMDQGTEREPQGRSEYSFITGNEVQEVGMFLHPRLVGSHASPDGAIGDQGLLELKCPEPAEHMRMLLGGKIKAAYETQADWQLACSERKWVDWCSFSPEFPIAMQLFKVRIYRDIGRIVALEAEVADFIREVKEAVEKLKATYP